MVKITISDVSRAHSPVMALTCVGPMLDTFGSRTVSQAQFDAQPNVVELSMNMCTGNPCKSMTKQLSRRERKRWMLDQLESHPQWRHSRLKSELKIKFGGLTIRKWVKPKAVQNVRDYLGNTSTSGTEANKISRMRDDKCK